MALFCMTNGIWDAVLYCWGQHSWCYAVHMLVILTFWAVHWCHLWGVNTEQSCFLIRKITSKIFLFFGWEYYFSFVKRFLVFLKKIFKNLMSKYRYIFRFSWWWWCWCKWFKSFIIFKNKGYKHALNIWLHMYKTDTANAWDISLEMLNIYVLKIEHLKILIIFVFVIFCMIYLFRATFSLSLFIHSFQFYELWMHLFDA